MADEPVFLFIATYDSEDDARLDYDALLELHDAGVVGTYDAAIAVKDEEGKVHVHKHEKPTQRGAWTGVGVGAVVGILFPPSLIASAVVGGAAGGMIGHLWHGMSRRDVKELGELLDTGDAALIVIGRSKLQETLQRELRRANRRIEKQLDVEAKEVEKDLAGVAS